MAIFRRKKRERGYVPPPPPPDELTSTVERLHIEAEVQFHEAERVDVRINADRDRILKIQRDNALGPRFWAAVGERRA